MSIRQTISPPTAADVERLSKQRAVLEQYLSEDDLRTKYTEPAGKLGLLRALLTQNVFGPNQTYELQCMGVVLGDAFVRELGMEWIMVQDEFGTDPAICLPGTSIILYPLTMISKRVEHGETVDVFGLFNAIAADVEKMKQQAQ